MSKDSSRSDNQFQSAIFDKQLKNVDLPAGKNQSSETVMSAVGRPFDLLKKVFKDDFEIVVVGYSSQGPAHAQNMRESFAKAGVKARVAVALRDGSPTRARAESDGFSVKDGTLVTPDEGIARADFVIMLISDGALASEGDRLLALMKPGATLGLAHGFYIGYLESAEQSFRTDIGVIGVCPKGMGPSVRRLYQQGSGINASFCVEQGDKDKMRDLALAWSLAIGSPYTFQTTLGSEWRSDIFGERAILLGGIHGIAEAVYGWKRESGMDPEQAYMESTESLVGPITKTISKEYLKAVYDKLPDDKKSDFRSAFNSAYPVLKRLMEKIYDDVSSTREIAEVVNDNFTDMPMSNVDGTEMWRTGVKAREKRGAKAAEYDYIDPVAAGIYVAGMVAQVDVLRARGHYWSEVINESIIEAVDSLNPFIRAKSMSFMVDNCSITARRGDRKWAPLFEAWLKQEVLPNLGKTGKDYFKDFETHDVHKVLPVFGDMRPDIDIAVQ